MSGLFKEIAGSQVKSDKKRYDDYFYCFHNVICLKMIDCET